MRIFLPDGVATEDFLGGWDGERDKIEIYEGESTAAS
jgi:hypothetical protein